MMETIREICKHSWQLDVEPFHVVGNVYYVGNTYVGCYLIDTGDGLILIDTAFPQTLYLLLESIRKLGFDPMDIKLILLTHGHYDHCGGMKKMKEYTGAKVYVGREDLFILKERHDLLYCYDLEYEDFAIDSFFKEQTPIVLGNTVIRTVHTPGHTPGTYSLFFQTVDNGTKFMCGLQGGLGLNTLTDEYLEESGEPVSMRSDYINSLKRISAIPVDVVLPSHPSQTNLLEKLEIRKVNKENILINRYEWKEMLFQKLSEMEKMIAESTLDPSR